MSDETDIPPEVADMVRSMIDGDRVIDPSNQDLDFGVMTENDRVVFRFSKAVHLFDLDPDTAVDYAGAIITAATIAQKFKQDRDRVFDDAIQAAKTEPMQ